MQQQRTRDEILRDMRSAPVSVESPWSRWEKFTYWLTGRVSERIYVERMMGMSRDDARIARLRRELLPSEGD